MEQNKNAADTAAEKANETAGTAHESIDKAASSARPAVDRFAESAHQAVDKMVGTANQYAQKFSERKGSLKGSQDQMIDDARAYIRQKPGTAIGIAVAAGFILSRIMR